jgi:hypothetical protein
MVRRPGVDNCRVRYTAAAVSCQSVSQSGIHTHTHTHTHTNVSGIFRGGLDVSGIFAWCDCRCRNTHAVGRSRDGTHSAVKIFFWRPTFRRTDRHSLWSSARPPTESQLFSAPHTNFPGGRRPIVDRVAKACRPLHTDQAGRGRASRVIADFAPHESARGTATAPRVRPKTATRRESVSGFGRGSAKAASPTVPRPSRSRSVAAGHCGFCATRVWRAR